jgi:hypothetical protein
MKLRHYPKSNGAPMAHSGLRHHWNFPRAGDGAKQRAIAPLHHGAPMAQTASRASPLTRYAPAALCLRRRSQSHRWSPTRDLAGRVFACAIPDTLPCSKGPARAAVRTRARQGWKDLLRSAASLGFQNPIAARQTLICGDVFRRSNIKHVIFDHGCISTYSLYCRHLRTSIQTGKRQVSTLLFCLPNRSRDASAAISTALNYQDRPDHPSRSDGVGRKFQTLGDLDIIGQHSAGPFQIWARLGLENPVGSGMRFPGAAGLACAFFWLGDD